MAFARECCWAFQAWATFWAIFEKFLLVSLLLFFRMAKLWQFSQGYPKLAFSEKVQGGTKGKFSKIAQKQSSANVIIL